MACTQSEIIFLAPIYNDSRFVEFRVENKNQYGPGSSWSLVRRVVDKIYDEDRHLISDSPVGAPYQAKVPHHLRNVTVIDSRPPGSARVSNEVGDPYFDLLSPLLRELEIGHVYVATDSSTSIAENANSFSASGTVVLLGGDTSIHEFVNALAPVTSVGLEIRLVVIPTGTGNALSISSGVRSPIDAVRQLFLSKADDFVPLSTLPVRFLNGYRLQGETSSVPGEIRYGEHRALVVVSWGFHSALVADSDTREMRMKYKDNPNDKFKEAAHVNLDTIKQSYHGDVFLMGNKRNTLGSHVETSPQKHIFGPKHSYLLFTLVTHLESNFLISPDSRPPSDDCMHMVAIEPFESLESQHENLMKIMTEVYNKGGHISDPLVTYMSLKNRVHVNVGANQSDRMRRWCLDGKIVVAEPGVVEIDPPTHVYNGWQLKLLRGNISKM